MRIETKRLIRKNAGLRRFLRAKDPIMTEYIK